MHSRAVRTGVVVLLLAAAAAAAAYLWWRYDVETRVLDDRARTLDGIVERTLPAVADIAAAQRAYVDYGLRDESSFARIADLLQQSTADAARFRLTAASEAGRARIDEALAALANLTAAAARARTQLQTEPLAAAEGLLGADGQQQVTVLTSALRAYHAAERGAFRDRRAALDTWLRAAVAALALLWGAVVVALMRARGRTRHSQNEAVATPGDGADRTRAAAEDPQIDLAATADVCTGIAQLKDASALPAVLERAAAVLDARGIVVWMGAGDELFAAAGWGYEPGIMQRMRPIPRAADNATAAAWRTGELRSVPADASSPGAIVAPMCAPDGCIGALAAEVRNGREHHVGTRAVAAIVAAQLSGVLAAWPAASTAAGRPDAGTAAGDTPVSEGDAAARRRRGP